MAVFGLSLESIKRLLSGAFFVFVFGIGVAQARTMPAIASAHPLATEAGMEILRRGGNAFDAAVAVSAALAVVEPYSSGLGGGGFWLLHRASDGYEVMIDGREKAPLAATAGMYLDDDGQLVPRASIDGPLAAGIPGEPAALVHIAERYGKLPLDETLAPAIRLAEQGFPVDDIYLKMLGFRRAAIEASPAAAAIFMPGGKLPDKGTRIVQRDLAVTLRLIAESGRAGFYAGETAKKLVEAVRKHGGIWQQKDLQDYRIVERRPVSGRYHEMKITTAALPSSGGIVLVEMLNQIEGYDLAKMDEAGQIHHIVEAMRRAYRDRAEYLGDADFVEVPQAMLLDKRYAAGLRQSINPDRATPSGLLAPTFDDESAGRHTTHFSIVDADGNRVAATLSINYPFGSGFVADGTGVLLNDEMDDFAARPGTPNVYGLVGARANAIEPGKRMLSSMTPAFLETPSRIAVVGTPGGSRIITMVLLAALAFEQSASAAEIVAMPRFHHQYLPDHIQIEPDALSAAVIAALEKKGHAVKPLDHDYGNMQIVVIDKRSGQVEAASDPRGIGKARAGLR